MLRGLNTLKFIFLSRIFLLEGKCQLWALAHMLLYLLKYHSMGNPLVWPAAHLSIFNVRLVLEVTYFALQITSYISFLYYFSFFAFPISYPSIGFIHPFSPRWSLSGLSGLAHISISLRDTPRTGRQHREHKDTQLCIHRTIKITQ